MLQFFHLLNFHNVRCWRSPRILDMSCRRDMFSSSQRSAAGSCERGYFIFLFSNRGAGGLCLLRIYVAVSGEAVNVYYLPL